MIRIVSGAVGQGKTSRLAEIFAAEGGGGIVTPRFVAAGATVGYRVRRLADGVECAFAAALGSEPAGWDGCDSLGRFSFSAAGLAFAQAALEAALAAGADPLFLDEAGPWELAGGGFAPQLAAIIAAGGNLVVAVRPACVADMVAKFFAGRRDEVRVETLSSYNEVQGFATNGQDQLLSQ